MTFKKTLKAAKSNKRYFLLMILLDLLFLLALVNINFVFLTPATQKVMQATQLMQADLDVSMPDVDSLYQNPTFMGLYHDVLLLFGQLLLWMFVAWIVFKSLVWYLSHKSFLKKIPFVDYMKKFIILSFFWFALILINLFIAAYLSKQLDKAGMFLFVVFSVVILYFSQIGFALLPASKTFKKMFSVGCDKAKRLIPVFLINAVLIAIGFAVPIWLAKISPWVGFFALIFVLLPILAFCRFHLIVAVWSKK